MTCQSPLAPPLMQYARFTEPLMLSFPAGEGIYDMQVTLPRATCQPATYSPRPQTAGHYVTACCVQPAGERGEVLSARARCRGWPCCHWGPAVMPLAV